MLKEVLKSMDHAHLFLKKLNFQEIGTDKEGRERVSENPELFIGKMRMLGHLTGYCHFIRNKRATSMEEILGRKLPLHWKQPK